MLVDRDRVGNDQNFGVSKCNEILADKGIRKLVVVLLGPNS